MTTEVQEYRDGLKRHCLIQASRYISKSLVDCLVHCGVLRLRECICHLRKCMTYVLIFI